MYASPALRRPFASLAGAGALIAMLASAGPAYAGKETSLTLKIGVAISETITETGNPLCPAIGQINGLGYSTELGAVRVQATDCFYPTEPFGNFAFFTKPGTMVTLTTASNEMLYGTYQGTATGQPFPIEAISANVSFNGGTGRFEKATGSATIDGIENIGTVPATGVLLITGKVTY